MERSEQTSRVGRAGLLAGFRDLDRILRGELTQVAALERGGIEISPLRISAIIIVLAMVSGACMGTFGLFRMKNPHGWQVLASMVKVPLLFYLTLLVTLPSLYVFNALVGSRLSLATVVRLLLASLAVMVAVLASLGPIVAFFSVSTTSYPFMLLFNVVVCGVSGGLGLLFLLQTLHRLSTLDSRPSGRGFSEPTAEPRPAEGHNPSAPAPSGGGHQAQSSAGALDRVDDRVLGKHVKTVFRIWVIVFALVGAQMGWVLRPFIGSPDLPFVWVRGRESNFFQGVLRTLQSLFSS
jgi:hypothetical protein